MGTSNSRCDVTPLVYISFRYLFSMNPSGSPEVFPGGSFFLGLSIPGTIVMSNRRLSRVECCIQNSAYLRAVVTKWPSYPHFHWPRFWFREYGEFWPFN